MIDRIGTEIAGYRIESLIARGGMGEVYLATQSFPERKVALKLLPHELASDQAFRERFIRESNAAASVEHPNIVPVYGAGDAEGELYIAMRYVEGEDLRSLLDREGTLAPERAVRICSQIAEALEEAHEHDLVHRDVKPGNILVAKGDRAYLTDFGLIRRSKLETDLTKTGQFMGTVDYVAPEQIKGGEVDGRADIYSLGCVLYECLTGVPPFRRDTEVATLYAHLEDPPPKPSAKRPELPLAFDEAVARAMAKRPGDRYATPPELTAGFRDATRPADGGAMIFKTRRARRVALLAVVVLVAASAIVLATIRRMTPNDAASTPGPPLNSIVEVDPETGKILATAPGIGGSRTRKPHAVFGEGKVWVLNLNTVYEIDPKNAVLDLTIPVNAAPRETFAVGFRTVWVGASINGGGAGGGIQRFDPSNGASLDSTSLHGLFAYALSVGDDAVWAGLQDGDLIRLNGETGRIEERFPSGVSSLDAIAVTSDAVWVADKLDGLLLRVDPLTTRVVERIPIIGNIDSLVADDSGAWILDRIAGTVTPVDPTTDTAGQPIRVGMDPSDIAIGLGSVWVTDQTEGAIYRIDPGLRKVLGRYELGAPLASIAVDQADGTLWVSVSAVGQA